MRRDPNGRDVTSGCGSSIYSIGVGCVGRFNSVWKLIAVQHDAGGKGKLEAHGAWNLLNMV